MPLQPVELASLRPFPLPKLLKNLPAQFLADFSRLYELVQGFVEELPKYRETQAQIVDVANQQIELVNEIVQILEEYEAKSAHISRQLKTMEELYREFLNLETYQYQLLSSNFNQNFLRTKFGRLAEASDKESMLLVRNKKSMAELDLTSFLLEFKQKRKEYHLRKEKLNRWEEDRVSGFI